MASAEEVAERPQPLFEGPWRWCHPDNRYSPTEVGNNLEGVRYAFSHLAHWFPGEFWDWFEVQCPEELLQEIRRIFCCQGRRFDVSDCRAEPAPTT